MSLIQPTPVRVFHCGDVMTGRGIDQILAHPGKPNLHEPGVRDARYYVEFAEREGGRTERPVEFSHIWGSRSTSCAGRSQTRP